MPIHPSKGYRIVQFSNMYSPHWIRFEGEVTHKQSNILRVVRITIILCQETSRRKKEKGKKQRQCVKTLQGIPRKQSRWGWLG